MTMQRTISERVRDEFQRDYDRAVTLSGYSLSHPSWLELARWGGKTDDA